MMKIKNVNLIGWHTKLLFTANLKNIIVKSYF